jgi:hypothetical protein
LMAVGGGRRRSAAVGGDWWQYDAAGGDWWRLEAVVRAADGAAELALLFVCLACWRGGLGCWRAERRAGGLARFWSREGKSTRRPAAGRPRPVTSLLPHPSREPRRNRLEAACRTQSVSPCKNHTHPHARRHTHMHNTHTHTHTRTHTITHTCTRTHTHTHTTPHLRGVGNLLVVHQKDLLPDDLAHEEPLRLLADLAVGSWLWQRRGSMRDF